MEEGIFPGFRAIGEEKELEEERRLCYVGITRAKNYLYLTCAKMRTIFGSTSYNKISRFVEEIPKEMLDGHEDVFGNKRNVGADDPVRPIETIGGLPQYRIGISVLHKKFGEGIILNIEPEEDDLKVEINFEKVGTKRLMAKYANLEIIE